MATKDFNTSPYYDDYDSSKGYHRVLFKPSFAVQARELTQLQTILQNQVKHTTDANNGSALIPGELIVDIDISYVALTTDLSSPDTITSIIGTVIGNSDGVRAKVVAASARTTLQISTDDTLTIWVSYLTSGTTTTTFASGDTLYKQTTGAYPTELDTTATWNTVGKHGDADNPSTVVGSGSVAQIRAGVYYVNGYAVEIVGQTLILDKYTTTPSYKIGFDVSESILTTTEDSTLTDNAVSSTNYQADGADRFKIALVLAKKSLTATTSEKFIEIAEVVNGKLHKKAENLDSSKGAEIVSGFDFEIRENKTTMLDSNGLYGTDSSGSSDKVSFGVDTGVANLDGVRTELEQKTFLALSKARTIEDSVADVSVAAEIGNYVVTDGGIIGSFASGDAQRAVLNFSPAVSGIPFPLVNMQDTSVFIGTARIRNIERLGNEFKIYLFDIRMDSGKDLVNVNELHVWTSSSTPQLVNKICDLRTEQSVANVTTHGVDDSLTSLKDTGKNTLLYQIGKGISEFDANVIISSVRQTFEVSPSSGTLSVSANANTTFDSDTSKILVYGSDGTKNKIFADSEITTTLNGAKTTVSITGSTFQSGQSYSVFATFSNNVATRANKSLGHNSDVFTTKTAVEVSTLALSKTDIIPTQWKVYMSSDFGTAALTSHTDISDRYTIDTGQRDNFYALGSIKLKSGELYPTGRITVAYWYFVTSTGDYMSASSYPTVPDSNTTPNTNYSVTDSYGTYVWVSVHDGVQEFKYGDIPTYTSDTTGRKYRLGDCIDLRSSKNDNGVTNSAFSGSGAIAIDPPERAVISGTGSDFYLGRVDGVYLDSAGILRVVEGVPSSNPIPPNIPYSGVPLYNIKFMPYTYDTNDIVVQKIGGAEYNDLSYFTALSALENSAENYNIGLGRLRRNVFIDPFTGHGFGDPSDTEYIAAIDPVKNELRPHFTVDSEEFEVFSADADTDLVHDSNLVTFPYTETTEVQNLDSNIDQTIRVADVTTYQGVVSVGYDNWKSTRSREDIKYNRNGAWDSLKYLDRADRTHGTIWNEWKTHWSGAKNSNFQDPTFGLSYDESAKSPVIPNVVGILNKNIGGKELGTDYTPYIRSKSITITVEGLKPATSISSIKFDGADITSSFSTPKTDANGKWTASYIIPNVDENVGTIKYQTGSKQIIIEANQSYAEGYYHAVGHVDTDGLATRPFDRSWDAQTDETVSQGIEVFSECFVTSLDLYFSAEDSVYNRPVIVQLRSIENGKVGNKVLPYSTVSKLTSAINIDGTKTNFAFSNPVYLKKGKYTITIITPASEYTVKALDVESQKGSNSLGADSLYLGKSKVDNKILKFTLYRAKFTISGGTPSIILQTKMDDISLGNNPFHTSTSAENRITVYQDGHGYIAGTTVGFNGVKGSNEQDLLMNSGSGNYTVGEVVFQGTGSFNYSVPYAKVISWVSGTRILKVASLSGTFSAADTITGVTSTTARTISSVSGAVNTVKRLHGVGIGVPSGTDTLVEGSGYTYANASAQGAATTTTGNGSGMRVNTTVTGGEVASVSIVFEGSGYADNDVVTITEGGNNDATFQINGVTGMNDDTFTVESVTANSFVIKNDTTAFTVYQDGYAQGENAVTIPSARRRADLLNYSGEEIIPNGTSIGWEESVAGTMIGATKVGLNSNMEYSTPTYFLRRYLRTTFTGDSLSLIHI